MNDRLPSDKNLSYSQLSEFLTCRHRWLLKYVHGIRPQEFSPALDLGSAFHEGIAGYFRTGKYRTALNAWYFKADAAWPMEDIPHAYGQIAHDAAELIEIVIQDFNRRGYRVATDNSYDKRTHVPMIEQRLTMPLFGTGFDSVYGFIDAFVLDRDDRLWLLDWKTRKTFKDDLAEEMNLQNTIYTALARHYGYNVVGSITYQISSKPPSVPVLLSAKGNAEPKMSRARIATTWKKYRQCLIEAGLEPSEYQDEMVPKLDCEFVRPLIAHRGPVQVQYTMEQIIIPAAIAMRKAYEHKPQSDLRIHNPLLCGSCAVRSQCLAGLRGYDVIV